jgi:hypothetical protein
MPEIENINLILVPNFNPRDCSCSNYCDDCALTVLVTRFPEHGILTFTEHRKWL